MKTTISANANLLPRTALVVVSVALLALGVQFFPTPRASGAPGAKAEPGMLVTPSWLAEHLSDKSVVILNIGQRAAYDAGHIPGARFVEMSGISTSQPLMLELPTVEKLKTSFEALGVSDNSRIVIAFSDNWISPATRVYFTLDYLGLGKQTSLLDGGVEAWRKAGRPIVTDVPQVTRGSITPHPHPELIVDAAWLAANLNKPAIAIVDARAPEFYSGASAGRMPRAGHIPGAVNIPFSTLADAANKMHESAALKKIFSEAGINQGVEVVSYCHIGQQATVVYFAAKYLGYDARLYDGSFEDWSRRSELPVAQPSSK